MRCLAAMLLVVGCGRIDFDPVTFTLARCDSQPITQLFLGHRSTCFLDALGVPWCVGEGVPLSPTFGFPNAIDMGAGWSDLRLGWGSAVGRHDGAIYLFGAPPQVADSDGSWADISLQ